jgi:hypothetical protein
MSDKFSSILHKTPEDFVLDKQPRLNIYLILLAQNSLFKISAAKCFKAKKFITIYFSGRRLGFSEAFVLPQLLAGLSPPAATTG